MDEGWEEWKKERGEGEVIWVSEGWEIRREVWKGQVRVG